MGTIDKIYVPTGLTYNTTLLEIVNSNLQLKLQDNPGQNFIQNFASGTGFIYDSDKAEFSGGQVQQKDQVPANAICGATYDEDVNLEAWSGGVVTGDAQGGAGITDQKLDLTGGVNKYVDYDATGNADSQQTGTIRFQFIPDYSGGGSMYMVDIGQAVSSNNNRIRIYQSSTLLFWAITNSAGAGIVSQAESFTPVADTIYEIELNWDITAGATRMFVNGNQLGTTHVGTGTRSSDINVLRLGKDLNGSGNPQFYINNLIIFDTVQHTSNYTPGYTVPNYIYAASNVTLPEMEYTEAGTLVSLDSFTTSESGSPRYTIQIGQSGNYLYWNGSAWAISDGTYNQANDATTFNANRATLPVEGEIYGQFKINFIDSNTQSAVATLTASLTAQIYPTSNPTAETTIGMDNEGLTNFLATISASGSDLVKFSLSKDSTYYYWDGSAWSVSTSYSQSNIAADILTNIASFNDSGANTKVLLYFHSEDGSTTPSFTSLAITYDFWAGPAPSANECIVYGYCYDIKGDPLSDVSVKVEIIKNLAIYNDELIIMKDLKTVTSDSTGYWDISLLETVNLDAQYQFTFELENAKKRYIVDVPNQESVNFIELTE